jgi:hypothetical protein
MNPQLALGFIPLICRPFLQETYYPFLTFAVDYIFSRAEAGKCLFVVWLLFVQP